MHPNGRASAKVAAAAGVDAIGTEIATAIVARAKVASAESVEKAKTPTEIATDAVAVEAAETVAAKIRAKAKVVAVTEIGTETGIEIGAAILLHPRRPR